MHRLIADNLEEYLGDKLDGENSKQVTEHLNRCEPCREEVATMRLHASLVRSLAVAEPLEPAPGFYARVLDTIERNRPVTIWSLFLDPSFSRQLVYASLLVLLVVGSYLFTGGRQVYAASPGAIIAAKDVCDSLGKDRDRDRARVLLTLATYRD
jgi:predicted anti-sigma-YlaC factor YlaD